MNFEQLHYFKTIYQTQSLNKAAKQLYISQPALSKALQSMELELGTTLFVRNKKGLCPTEAGKLFFQSASAILQIYEDTLFKLNSSTNFTEPLTIFAVPCVSNIYLPSILKDLYQTFPNLKLHFREILPKEIDVLQKTPVSFALLMGGDDAKAFITTFSEYISIMLKQEACYAFVSKYSPWAKKKQIDTNTISEQSIDFREFEPYSQHKKSYTPKNFMNNFSSSQEFILSQNGIHILPLGVGKKAYTHPDIVAIPLKDNVTVSYNFIVNHMLFSSEFAFVLRHTIKLLKTIL